MQQFESVIFTSNNSWIPSEKNAFFCSSICSKRIDSEWFWLCVRAILMCVCFYIVCPPRQRKFSAVFNAPFCHVTSLLPSISINSTHLLWGWIWFWLLLFIICFTKYLRIHKLSIIFLNCACMFFSLFVSLWKSARLLFIEWFVHFSSWLNSNICILNGKFWLNERESDRKIAWIYSRIT